MQCIGCILIGAFFAWMITLIYKDAKEKKMIEKIRDMMEEDMGAALDWLNDKIFRDLS